MNAELSVSNHYMSIGRFSVILTGANIVSKEQVIFPLVTTKGPCFDPYVDLLLANQCPLGQACTDQYYQNVLRSEEAVVRAIVRFDCEASKIGHFNWWATAVADNGDETLLDLNNTVLYGTSLRSIVVQPRTLDYGKLFLQIAQIDL